MMYYISDFLHFPARNKMYEGAARVHFIFAGKCRKLEMLYKCCWCFMINYDGEVLNSKTEWNQPRIIRTTIIQGGAEMVGGRVLLFHRDGGGAPPQPSLVLQPSPPQHVGGRAGDQSTAGQQGMGGEGALARHSAPPQQSPQHWREGDLETWCPGDMVTCHCSLASGQHFAWVAWVAG